MKDREVVLGITGSIAAYKSVELLRALMKEGARVTCVMTRSAQHFVGPLTFQSLSGRPVIRDLFLHPTPTSSQRIVHVGLADETDLLLVAPASANIIGKFAAGIADDFLSTFFLSVRCPVLLAPAMDERMFSHPVCQENIRRLKEIGVKFVEPAWGELASGRMGRGRMAEVSAIVEAVQRILAPKSDLTGLTVLVSAGPTREYLDPIRFLSNPSSGRMGYAIAAAARSRGARVVLVSGPTSLSPCPGVEREEVVTAEEMRKAMLSHLPQADIVIMAAAVADYRPVHSSPRKLKKGEERLWLELERTTDILKEIGEEKGRRILVGFAAETEDLVANARRKLEQKNLDLVIANDIHQPGGGFGQEANQVKIIDREGGIEEIPLLPKAQLADIILDRVGRLMERTREGGSPEGRP
jgi:phosphopantothenoylcysteine decarboxylase/phosphopantothenate--cysteine ligase